MSQAASALSDAFRVAVYDTHDKAYPPETRPPSKRDGDYLLDKHAVLAADCWVYPVVSVFPDEQHAHVPFEFKVDPSGVVLRPIGKPNLDKPIEKRPAAFEYDPDHPHGVTFAHKVDSQGRPLMVRLFASPFRLTKTAISELCSSKYIKGRKKHLPYLWTWSKAKTSALKSADGYYIQESRTFLTVAEDGGIPQRVWMAFNPFRNAKRRSDIYVRAWTRFAKRFEPDVADRKRWHKEHLLDVLNATIHENAGIPARYKKALDYGKIEAAYTEFDDDRASKKRKTNSAAKHLAKMLRHPFFEILQYSSMQNEGVLADSDYSEALVSHIETLAFVTRNLHSSPAGVAAINHWIAESEVNESHFINQLIFPPRRLQPHVFKSVRWFSKGTFAVAESVFGKVIALREKTAKQVAEALFHVGIFETAEDALGGLKNQVLSLDDILDTLKLEPSGARFTKTQLIKIQEAKRIQSWLERDQSETTRWYASATKMRRVAFFMLDSFNVYLAYNAVKAATNERELMTATAGTAVATTFLVLKLVEHSVSRLSKTWRENPHGTKMWRVLRLAEGLGAVVFALVNISNALDAYRKGSARSGHSLLVAAGAEGIIASVYLTQVIVGAPVFGGLLAAMALIAAAAYTIAEFSKVDPLEKFLENCEYGITPYSDDDYVQPWTGGSIPSWKGDFRRQTRILIRVLTRFAVHWKRTASNPALLRVMLDCHRRTMDTRVTVTFVAEFPDRDDVVEKVVLDHRKLEHSPSPIVVDAPNNYIEAGAERVTVHAQLELLHEGYDYALSAVLWNRDPAKNHDIHRAAAVD